MNNEPPKRRRLNDPPAPMESVDPPSNEKEDAADRVIVTCSMAGLSFIIAAALLLSAIGNMDNERLSNIFMILLAGLPIAASYCLFTKRPWHALGMFIGMVLPLLLGRLCFG